MEERAEESHCQRKRATASGREPLLAEESHCQGKSQRKSQWKSETLKEESFDSVVLLFLNSIAFDLTGWVLEVRGFNDD